VRQQLRILLLGVVSIFLGTSLYSAAAGDAAAEREQVLVFIRTDAVDDVKPYLDTHADVLDEPLFDGETILACAVAAQARNVIAELSACGASWMARGERDITPSHMLAFCKDDEFVQWCVRELSVDLDAVDYKGCTPADFAIEKRDWFRVGLLLSPERYGVLTGRIEKIVSNAEEPETAWAKIFHGIMAREASENLEWAFSHIHE